MRKLITALLGLLAIQGSGVAASKAKIQPAPPPPPYTGAYQPMGVDEVGLWRHDDESERALANSPNVIRDDSLNRYVKDVLCSAVDQDRCQSVRLYILRVPVFNATMSPNGTMRVFSGLLLRAQSEAELAAVLGHEFGHFEKRHTLARHKAWRSGTDVLAWAAVLTSMSGSPDVRRSFQDLQSSVYGGLYRFNRDNEREADLIGLGYLNKSRLRPQAASRVWRNLILEAESSAASRGLRKPDFNRIAFFTTHPPEGERVNYLYALAEPSGEQQEEGAERYASALAPWLRGFLDDQIALNDFGGSDFIINKLVESGWTADLWRARGDLFRGRGHPRDLMNAVDFYGKAAALNPNLASAHRGLGLSLIKTGRRGEGSAALQRYLQLSPDATDANMIKMTLSSIGALQ